MTNQKQIDANQQNAQLSTGPKTDEGKVAVSQNAIKHGILSKWTVLSSENKEEFESIRQAFIDDLKPQGAVEEVLVERIVTCYWRMHRVMIAEQGAIKKRYEKGWFDRLSQRANQAHEYRVSGLDYHFKTQKMANSIYAHRAIEELKEILNTVEREGYLLDDDQDKYIEMMNIFEDKEASKWFFFFNLMAQGKIEGEDKEMGKKALIHILKSDIDDSVKQEEAIKQIEDKMDQADAMMDLVPDTETIDKLTRYETSLERSFYQALAALNKLREGKTTTQPESMKVEFVRSDE